MSECGCNGTEFFCDLNAFTPAERENHFQHTRELFAKNPDSIAWSEKQLSLTFDRSEEMSARLAEWAVLESRCCPFLTFNLNLPGNSDQLVLSVTGAPGALAFLREELSAMGAL
jgi:hypothetical protein